MADERNSKETKGFSFSFSKKKESRRLKEVSKTLVDSLELQDQVEDKDFILSAEGKELKRYNSCTLIIFFRTFKFYRNRDVSWFHFLH